ncbi:TonB-dependent receptor [Pseudomaricurvus alkylphenolicus]|jgi:outer membrane receptor protein involved in Fe transport|uniref:TonB-dependent receptor n=1 Tax=Pseudomaricurvus alkylphenolicus TaxID=1306991 RepID=UPI0014240DF1|nr:TonB-dependent receptor [Pseudomaricurvus alkylphenolicus]NIB40745.1 TonB-dependent receptor [Pseudomaricurvus alkylphenolicus]
MIAKTKARLLLSLAAISPLAYAGNLQIPFHQRPLAEVLADYEAAGYPLIYSSDLIRPELRVEHIPTGTDAIERLNQALRPLGLMVSPTPATAPGPTRWMIIRDPQLGRRVSGRITDADTDKPLSGVRIQLVDPNIIATVFTNQQGYFELYLPERPSQLSLSHSGYTPTAIGSRQVRERELNIPLQPAVGLEEIVVTASRYDLQSARPLSTHQLSTNDLVNLPELGDDALRAANHLPGTASVGLSAQPNIRGGLQDETLVLFNQIELLEPFHLKDFQSVFSSLNPSLIESIEVYTGGFPARYGDRMSGVMDISPVQPLPELGGEINISFLNASFAGYGHFGEGRGRWLISARRGNLDLVTDYVNPTLGKPSYSDAYGQVSWRLSESVEIETGLLLYNDDVKLNDLEEAPLNEGEITHSRYRNTYAWFQLSHEADETTHGVATLSHGRIEHQRDGAIVDPEEGDSLLTEDNHFDVWSLSYHWHRDITPELGMDLGGKIQYQKGDYRLLAEMERDELAELLGVDTELEEDLALSPELSTLGLYGSVKFLPVHWLSLEAGLRWDVQHYSHHFRLDDDEPRDDSKTWNQLSPRVSARVRLNDDTALRASLGRFYQPESINELQIADGIDEFQSPQYTDGVILGLDHQRGNWYWRLEAFYKDIHDPKRRYENLFNSLVLLPEAAPDRIELKPTKARAQGVEASLRYQPGNQLSIWASYSHSSADDFIPHQENPSGDWQPRTWDQTHTLSTGIIWQQHPWTLSAAFRWHSGWQTSGLPDNVETIEPLALERNRKQLPHFASLDVRASHTWQWGKDSLELFIEITNLLNRKNIGAVDYELEENDNDGFDISGEEETLMPLVPSVGFIWKFHGNND